MLMSINFSASAASTKNVKVFDTEVVEEMTGIYAIEGHATNMSKKTFKFVSIQFNLYKDNVLVGNAAGIMQNVSPNQTWKFKAIAINEFDKYEITSIDAF